MSELYLSRVQIDAQHERLGPVLFPDDPARRIAVSHRLVWSMFAPDVAQRPFLYREEAASHAGGRAARGAFHVLSSAAPGDSGGLFHVDTKPFAPKLKAGQRLRFCLRANPTTQRTIVKDDGKRGNKRNDVVMKALHGVARTERHAERPRLIREAGLAWLIRQGEGGGFRLPDPDEIGVDGYEQFLVDPENRRDGKRAVHSRIEYDGVLEVVEPQAFLAKLATGFGRARAFGNGLMLIARA